MAEKIKISKKEVLQMIQEEYTKKKTEISLKKRLSEINEKIAGLLKECGVQEECGTKQEEKLEEVEAGGEKKVASTGWTGEKNGDVKFDEKFKVKGTHKLEEDEEFEVGEEDFNSPDEEVGGDAPVDTDTEIEVDEKEDITTILQKLADAIEEKVEEVVDEKLGDTEGTPETPEATDEVPTLGTDEAPAGEETIAENAEEPQDGHSPATEKSSDGPEPKTPFTEKQDVIKEGEEKGKAILSEEMKRMQILSGIRKPDELV